MVLGHIPLGFIGFNKPPIEGDQLPAETHRVHYVSIKTNTSTIITSKTITNVVMVSIVFFNITCYKCLQREPKAWLLLLLHLQDDHILV